jgi:hypothetical protein
MTHRVELYDIDAAGNVVDVIGANYYCSDECARLDPAYDGWNGSCEAYAPVQCPCGERLEWHRWNSDTEKEETVTPDALDYWDND